MASPGSRSRVCPCRPRPGTPSRQRPNTVCARGVPCFSDDSSRRPFLPCHQREVASAFCSLPSRLSGPAPSWFPAKTRGETARPAAPAARSPPRPGATIPAHAERGPQHGVPAERGRTPRPPIPVHPGELGGRLGGNPISRKPEGPVSPPGENTVQPSGLPQHQTALLSLPGRAAPRPVPASGCALVSMPRLTSPQESPSLTKIG